ncbi:hypothetical protein JZO77_17325 [Enterococcus hulanensis]|uniref:hypothetical protein n=1 Tax=Enterococcus hulanensis TaxID=2559929 RepID=UPI001A8D6FCD|nr:hypothetical protein [Enterococcus hulanensis]MBO0458498.1 hypothetical protein [Enterococcus hulanensis]
MLNHRSWLAKILFLSLLLSTLMCLILPIHYQKKMEAANQEVLDEYKKVAGKVDTSVLTYQKKYNNYLLEKTMITDASKPDFTIVPEKKGVIGAINFPTVRLPETPIYKEETKQAFFHYKYGSFPTAGKSGHLTVEAEGRWRDQVRLMELAQLKIGDCFFVTMNNQNRAYQITEIRKAQDKNPTVIQNKQLLTVLMKDTSVFINNQLVITGEQIAKSSIQKANVTPKINFSYSFIVRTFLLLNGVFFGWLVLSYQLSVRRAHSRAFRTKNGGYRKLWRLLQITRGYFILLTLIMGFFLAVMIYRFAYLR